MNTRIKMLGVALVPACLLDLQIQLSVQSKYQNKLRSKMPSDFMMQMLGVILLISNLDGILY